MFMIFDANVVTSRKIYEDFDELKVAKESFMIIAGIEFKNYSYHSDPSIFEVSAILLTQEKE